MAASGVGRASRLPQDEKPTWKEGAGLMRAPRRFVPRFGRPLLAAGLIPLLLAACNKGNDYVPPPPPKVDVAQPLRQDVQRYLYATGTTSAVSSTTLVARVQGFLDKIDYQDGDTVKAGDVLFVIEQQPYQLAVEQAQAAQAGAEAAAKQSELTYNRQVDLLNRHVAAQQDVDNAAAQRDADQAKLKQAQVDTKQAELNLGYTEVKAPFDGIATAHQVSLGELVGTGGATALATVIQLEPIYAQFSISQGDIQRIRMEIAKRGLTTEELKKIPVELGLETENGYPHKGTLNYGAPSVASTTGTLPVRAVFPNAGHVLLPGYFVRIRIPIGAEPDRLLVPDRALGSDQGGRYLLVVGKDNVVEQRGVTIGQQVGQLRVIEKGIEPGDSVLVSGLMHAVPGEKVEPTTVKIDAGEAVAR
jgi:RND family efflux transporter MFP subunit